MDRTPQRAEADRVVGVRLNAGRRETDHGAASRMTGFAAAQAILQIGKWQTTTLRRHSASQCGSRPPIKRCVRTATMPPDRPSPQRKQELMPISEKLKALIRSAWDDGAPCLLATQGRNGPNISPKGSMIVRSEERRVG